VGLIIFVRVTFQRQNISLEKTYLLWWAFDSTRPENASVHLDGEKDLQKERKQRGCDEH